MNVFEGRGFLVRSSPDTPFSGWLGADQLDALAPLRTAPWLFLQALAELAALLPGGLALLLNGARAEAPPGFWGAVGHLPFLTLHVRHEAFSEHLEGPVQGWFHGPRPPGGAMGRAWRQGWIGWVPEPGTPWSLPGIGRAEGLPEAPEEILPGGLWGELVLPLGALKELKAGEVAPVLAELQAGIERNLSQRMSAHAWPPGFPFQRRRTGWRIAVLGGREFQTSGGSWDEIRERLDEFTEEVTRILKCPIHLGTSHDPLAASLLGHQAMREGLPWRYSLPIPPAGPTFTPGLGADPREPAPLESRAAFPPVLAPLLAHPPVALLRLPHPPQESAVEAFLGKPGPHPAIRWLPPGVPPPGPHTQERPWATPGAFVPLVDASRASHPSLFEDPGGVEDPLISSGSAGPAQEQAP